MSNNECHDRDMQHDFFANLICPDCGEELQYRNHGFKCEKCSRTFLIQDGIINLLPSHLEENKVNEDRIYKLSEIEKNKLLKMRENCDARFFEEEFLPRRMHISGAVLEIGAGLCWMSSIFKLKVPWARVTASDVSATALQKGRMVSSILGVDVDRFVACDIEKLPFKNGTFDVVMGASVIHHLPHPKRGISEICRVLKKGGRAYVLDFGMAKILKNRVVMASLKSEYTYWGAAENICRIVEKVFSFEEWESLFSSIGFKWAKMSLERNYRTPPPVYEGFHLKFQELINTLFYKATPYYCRMLSSFPDAFVKNFMASGIGIVAEK